MREYEVPVDVPAQQMFDHVSNPDHLWEFRSDLSGERLRGDRTDEGVRVDVGIRSVWWETSEGDQPGELVIHEEVGDRCRVQLRLRSDDGGDSEARTRFEQAVAVLAHGAAAHTDAVRADHQDGWSG